MSDEMDARIDAAVDALGEESDFIVKGVPGASGGVPYSVGLFCRLCPVPDSEIGQGIESVGEIELWEIVADARKHYDETHAGTRETS